MESEFLAGNEHPKPPPETLPLLKKAATSPEFGLLAYRATVGPKEDESPKETRENLGKLIRGLPESSVRKLARTDLIARLQEHLRQVQLADRELDQEVLVVLERYLHPGQIDENVLLLALDGFFSIGNWARCMDWGRVLYRSEVRPTRKGAGAWREMRCRQARGPKLVSATNLLLLADSGKTGPFALALSALAGEKTLRAGRMSEAIQIYEAALQSVAEPRLVGPVLLRAGELNVYHGRTKLGVRHLLRGLSATDEHQLAHDPFRKAGLVALGRAVTRQRLKTSDNFMRLVKHERKRADPWWKPAYGYLGFRVSQTSRLRGEDVFSRATSELRKTNELEIRIREIVGEEALEEAMEQEDVE
jgi:hypothetical protein